MQEKSGLNSCGFGSPTIITVPLRSGAVAEVPVEMLPYLGVNWRQTIEEIDRPHQGDLL
jgi:hypothetical protein